MTFDSASVPVSYSRTNRTHLPCSAQQPYPSGCSFTVLFQKNSGAPLFRPPLMRGSRRWFPGALCGNGTCAKVTKRERRLTGAAVALGLAKTEQHIEPSQLRQPILRATYGRELRRHDLLGSRHLVLSQQTQDATVPISRPESHRRIRLAGTSPALTFPRMGMLHLSIQSAIFPTTHTPHGPASPDVEPAALRLQNVAWRTKKPGGWTIRVRSSA
ncbi:hypothetical protein [Saccharopolyspora spinosa]|uniref:hypothetical protein n=1 Tax=Saccharopolyspora spinosa TaxID=60894 RepID=UPI003BA98BF3